MVRWLSVIVIADAPEAPFKSEVKLSIQDIKYLIKQLYTTQE